MEDEAISPSMNAKIVRLWKKAEHDALKELDAARTNSALKEAARNLMYARRRLLELTNERAGA